jgi:flagellar assembly factor FliW
MSMKVAAENVLDQETWLKPMEFTIPAGIIGFPEVTHLELIYNPDELPFMWLRSAEEHALNFIVIEPLGLIPGYAVEMSDEDAAILGIERAEDALVLNIVTFHPDEPETATVNLIGPVVINRRTLEGRQIVIANFADHSSRHSLLPQDQSGR